MERKLLQQQEIARQQEQEQVEIPAEVVTKFDGDKELVEKFLENGYTVSELQGASVLHPTRNDPIAKLEDGTVAGMWIGEELSRNSPSFKFTHG